MQKKNKKFLVASYCVNMLFRNETPGNLKLHFNINRVYIHINLNYKMARYMDLEILANELLLNIFEYLPAVDLLRAFYNLNLRLNHLLLLHFRSVNLDFRSVSQYDFNHICQEYLPTISDHIAALCLSNNDDTPQQIEVFLQHGLNIRQFYSLRSLSLYDLCSNKLMNELMLQWKDLPNLTHLTLAGCYIQFNQIETQQLIDNIWSLSNLIYCYLNIHFGETNIFLPTVKSLSLKYLFIWTVDHHQNEVNAILKRTPNLQHFSILFNIDDNDNDTQQSTSSITKLNLYLTGIEEDVAIKFFKNMPNLNHLIIEINDDTNRILNGYQWENLIRNYLPNLKKFRFRMEFRLNRMINEYEQISNLLNSFQSSFWIKEHKWFIRCHWNSFNNLVYLYSLPYTFKAFHFDYSTRFESTCPDDRNYLFYNHVNDLRYSDFLNEKSVLSSIRFSNINHLSITLPINENIWSVISKQNCITSLDVLINEQIDVQMELQNFIDQSPHLHSLSFSSVTFLSMSIFELRNSSIRRIDLREYHHYFSDEECNILSRSLLPTQCEFLSINIQNHTIVIDLIANMINLRALNIQCANDKLNEAERNELTVWLKNHLPSTCIISTDVTFHNDIRIWIR